MSEQVFEQATRAKLRFETPRGSVSVEDLWDLPLTSATGKASLDGIAVMLHKQLRETAESVSFVQPAAAANKELQLKFDVAKHILDVRVKERDDEKLKRDRSEKKQHLLEILARKQNAELESKTAEEITAMINTL